MNGDSGAGVVTAPPPTNPPHKERYFDRVDESSPEYQRERNMAPDLRQDFNMMEQRKRVSMILQSPAFCDELESLIQDQMKKGKTPTSLLALQQIADFMSTSAPPMYPAAPQGGMAALNMSLGMVTPVNDLRGSDSIAYDKGEKLLRCKLAAFYRLTDLFSWSQLIYNHLTVRLNSEQERFLIVPFGLLYSEVTASSLVKIDLQGEIVDRGSTNLGVNQAGFTLHSSIYAARPDVKCIVHIHTAAGAAVSAMKCGLLPISPEALSLGEVSYHDYHGILVDEEESVLIQKNLGPKSKVLILRNHGLVSVGETVEEAFYYIHNLVTACEIQVRTLASAGGPNNLIMLDPSKYKSRPRHLEPLGDESSSHPKWQIGEQEFEAMMRMLDNLGYRTGYPYRCPALRDKAKKYSDVETPPSATGYSYAEDSDSGVRSPLKHSFQRQPRDKTRWLASESAEEGQDGSTSPKAKTKVWTNITHDHVKPLLQSLSSGVCVPSCITNCLWTKEDSLRQAAVANQFVPLNTNPKEVQEMRNKIREQNLQDKKTAGPQSQVLTGAMVDRSYVQGELVTASKAIIEKEYQPRVVVSKTGPNPFNKLTDQELDEYRKEVELKQKGTEAQVEGVQTPDVTSTQDNDDPQATATPPPSTIPSRGTESGRDSPVDPPGSPHKEFHSAVLRALGCDVECEPSAGQTPETEEENVPRSPVPVEEEAQQEQTFKDESDDATLKQNLPDLTPDDVFEDSALPAEDPVPEETDPAPKSEGEEPVAGDDTAGDHGSDESSNKSPSKKKKFHTPSFLKKNKKKSETQ
ncbi:alpha-adducin-like isoform X2 [Carassius carassius]|uniref:alpha-adducin-like isoform X2 n=1 Tax=Carassius carassius TaxID=217509 RepID=UPI002868B96C|nr:alpha-adducin-like isoform X2 [Carassius carassius]